MEYNLMVKYEHKAPRALKKVNLESHNATKLRMSNVYKLDKFWLCAYEKSVYYKEKIKLYHD